MNSASRGPTKKRQTAREYLDLQRLMAGAVMRPLAADGGMRAKWSDGRATGKVAGTFIKPNDRLTSFERLEIYNRQYWMRLKDCFYDDYPGLRAILGDDRFERLALAYLERYPSASFTLRNLGRRLLEFLAAEPRWITPGAKLARDMARLEWAHVEAFDNEAKAPLEVDSLLGRDPARIHLKLQPHVSLLRLDYELDEFLIDVKKGNRLRSDASNAMEARKGRAKRSQHKPLKPKPLFLAVHRHNDSVYYKRLLPGQFQLLTAFQENASLETACAELAETAAAGGGTMPDLKSWFENWASLGWFCKLA